MQDGVRVAVGFRGDMVYRLTSGPVEVWVGSGFNLNDLEWSEAACKLTPVFVFDQRYKSATAGRAS